MRVLWGAVLLSAFSCGTPAPVDAGVEDSGVLWPNDTVALTADLVPGFGGVRCVFPDGGAHRSRWRVELDAGVMDYDFCWSARDGGSGGEPRIGTLVLDAGTLSALETAGRAMRRSTRTVCGADKAGLTLVLATPSTQVRLKDDFYACMLQGGELAVTEIEGVFEVLAGATPR